MFFLLRDGDVQGVEVNAMFRWRSWMLYCAVALIWVLTVNQNTLTLNHMNSLKGMEGYLDRFSQGKEEQNELIFRDGVRYYKEFVWVSPASAHAYGNLGFCYFYLKEYDKAIRAYRKAIEILPKFYALYCDAGTVYLKADKKSEGAGFLRGCVDRAPGAEKFYQVLMKTSIDSKAMDAAQVFGQSALRARRDREEAYSNLIDAYAELKDYPKMRQTAVEAAYTYPQNAKFYYMIGLADFISKDCKNAIKYFDKAVQLNANHVQARYFLGLCSHDLGSGAEHVEGRAAAGLLTARKMDTGQRENEPRLHFNYLINDALYAQ